MKEIKVIVSIVCLLIVAQSFAQKRDTIEIKATDVNTRFLLPGTHQYLIYFKNGADSSRIRFQFWTRTIEFTKYNGKDAILIS